MSSVSYAPHVFYGGHSLILINLDHSKVTGLTNAVCHSYDVRVTLSSTHVTIFCTTRRCDVLRISLFHVVDIRRRRLDASNNSMAAVEIDFTVPTGPMISAAGGGSTKALRCIVQCELGDGPNDGLFHALLALWSAHRSGAPQQAGRIHQPPPSSSSASIFGSMDFTSNDEYKTVGSSPAFSAGAAAGAAFRSPVPYFGNSNRFSSDSVVQGGSMVGGGYSAMEGPSTPRRQQQQPWGSSRGTPQVYSGQLPPQVVVGGGPSSPFFMDVAGDRMRQQLCSELEMELQLIQQRRMQRQQLLLNLQRPVGESISSTGTSSPSSSSSGNVFRDATVDPNSAAAGFASLCPHCGIFSSDEHTATCPHRVVQCLRCLSLMKMVDFVPHASVCSAQYNTPKHGLSPYSPVPPPPQQPPLREDGSPSQGSPELRALSEVPESALPPSIVAMTSGGGGGGSSAPAPPPQASPLPTAAPSILRKSASTVQQSAVGTSSKCPWCGKMTPPDHERKCAERRVRCVVCGDEIYLREKEDHRKFCKTPSKSHPSSSRMKSPPSERRTSSAGPSSTARRTVSFV
jgi:hypothetical protein